jgi:hypothetical protein
MSIFEKFEMFGWSLIKLGLYCIEMDENYVSPTLFKVNFQQEISVQNI